MKHTTTPTEDKSFTTALFRDVEQDVLSALKDALGGSAVWVLEWVAENFAPEDVYQVRDLEQWARDAGWSEPE